MIKKDTNEISATQIAGCDPDIMGEAAKICEDNGSDNECNGVSCKKSSKWLRRFCINEK